MRSVVETVPLSILIMTQYFTPGLLLNQSLVGRLQK